MTTPTLVIVPGAWHTPSHWENFVESMPGVDVRVVQLPSCSSRDAAQLGDLRDDAAAVRETVSSVDGPVVVLAHSYGGVPTTEALGADTENVQRIIYLAAFVLDEGQSIMLLASEGGTKEPDLPFWKIHRSGGYLTMVDPVDAFYHDVEPALAQKAIDGLNYQSLSSLEQPLTNVAWRTIPSTYIICDEDRAVPFSEMFAQNSQHVRHFNSSHSPFLSKPKELAAVVLEEMDRLN